jgi:hypothetical protein
MNLRLVLLLPDHVTTVNERNVDRLNSIVNSIVNPRKMEGVKVRRPLLTLISDVL